MLTIRVLNNAKNRGYISYNFAKKVVPLQTICENGLHLSNSSELDCIRFAPSLHPLFERIARQ